MEILSVENLNFTYAGQKKPALEDISFSVEKGSFTALIGATGSGKSTLLKLLKRELAPAGDLSGKILCFGKTPDEMSEREAASRIGFVMQQPDQQLVTDKVWHELAFGLENLGMPREKIRRRVAEMAGYFGIEDWFEKKVEELSGGQKQLLNLASVMVMQPDILLLDEPTAQLDPIAASDFISTLQRLNRELSLTIILIEHRLEEVIPVCGRLLVMKQGRLLTEGTPEEAAASLDRYPELLEDMPAPVRLYHRFRISDPCPLTVREGREFVERNFENTVRTIERPDYIHSDAPALELSDVMFRYERSSPDVLKHLSLTVYENEIFCILGGNGSGKSTTLSVVSGLRKPYHGKVRIFGKDIASYKGQSLYNHCLSLLPQNVQTLFLENTVREELKEGKAGNIELPYDLKPLYETHPYDLSGGEQQLLALAKVLAADPKLLLMDEPTKGLDPAAKRGIISILRKLKEEGRTIVIVTHDVEFAAECADRCAMFFRGEITSTDTPGKFFSENYFYTTGVNRMLRENYDGIVTLDEAEEVLKKNGRKTC